MNQDIKAKMLKSLAYYALNFKTEITPAVAAFWVDEMASAEYPEAFGNAFGACCRQPGRVFFPRLGEVLAVYQANLPGSQSKTAEEWWLEVQACARKSYSEAKAVAHFQDYPAVVHALKSAPYDRIRYGDTERELPFVAKRFCQAFSDFSAKNQDRQAFMALDSTHRSPELDSQRLVGEEFSKIDSRA